MQNDYALADVYGVGARRRALDTIFAVHRKCRSAGGHRAPTKFVPDRPQQYEQRVLIVQVEAHELTNVADPNEAEEGDGDQCVADSGWPGR